MNLNPNPKALLLENIHTDGKTLLESSGVDVDLLSGGLSEDELIETLNSKNYEFLGVRSATKVTRKVIENCPNLISVGAFSIGTNQLDLQACSDYGIAAFNAPFSNTRSVVELAIAEIIALSRQLTLRDKKLHNGDWDKTAKGSFEIRHKTLGIIGYGNIGSQLSVLAESLGMHVVFYDINEKLSLGNATRIDTIEELLSISDFVTIHVDGRKENTNFFDEEYFSQMKDGAYFINLSRGFIVDTDALVKNLKSGKIAGAGVDVFPTEPKSQGDHFEHELQNIDNVILTPHVGGSTLEAQKAIGTFVTSKMLSFYQNGATDLSVNLPEITLKKFQDEDPDSIARILHIHKNLPGIMSQINSILGENNVNIERQQLATRNEFGYVATDVSSSISEDILSKLFAIDGTLRVRIINK
ncbi:MAG: phosphoglycerate dehydrogenase [Bifidobacteriaceae bacterium]|jgi:D-3-phosphoglycerate dehydrogenase|nr:phosphoglycerate dehydrogenase [Bifidobacteriaceae bacterium]